MGGKAGGSVFRASLLVADVAGEGPRGVPSHIEAAVWLSNTKQSRAAVALDSKQRKGPRSNPPSAVLNRGSKCEWCGKTDSQAKQQYSGEGLSRAHFVVHSPELFSLNSGRKRYRERIDMKSERNYWKLCGSEGQVGSCHWALEHKHASCVYNPFGQSGWTLLSFSKEWHGNHLDRKPPAALIHGHMPYRRVAGEHAKQALANNWCAFADAVVLQRQLDILCENSCASNGDADDSLTASCSLSEAAHCISSAGSNAADETIKRRKERFGT